jgi:hypothetical protein
MAKRGLPAVEEVYKDLMTEREACEALEISPSHLNDWVDGHLLPVTLLTVGGRPLFWKEHVERAGARLAAIGADRIVHKLKRRRHGMALLQRLRYAPCGCAYPSTKRDEADGLDPEKPIWLCSDGRALQASVRLAEVFAAATPADPFFARLAETARAAFERHLHLPAEAPALPAPEPREAAV